MGLYEELVERALSFARAKKIKRLVVSPFYVFSELERGGAGLAYFDREFVNACCEESEEPLWKRPADLIIKRYLNPPTFETPLALSVINAVLNSRKEILKETASDPLEVISLSLEDEVLMIGYFEPLVKKLQGKVKKIWVVERPDPFATLSQIENFEKIKFAIVTSATLSNKGLHLYFPYLERIPEVILMGPTTPLDPEVFKFTPITWLSGAIVKDSELLFRLVCEGKGTKSFFKNGALEKINLRVKKG